MNTNGEKQAKGIKASTIFKAATIPYMTTYYPRSNLSKTEDAVETLLRSSGIEETFKPYVSDLLLKNLMGVRYTVDTDSYIPDSILNATVIFLAIRCNYTYSHKWRNEINPKVLAHMAGFAEAFGFKVYHDPDKLQEDKVKFLDEDWTSSSLWLVDCNNQAIGFDKTIFSLSLEDIGKIHG